MPSHHASSTNRVRTKATLFTGKASVTSPPRWSRYHGSCHRPCCRSSARHCHRTTCTSCRRSPLPPSDHVSLLAIRRDQRQVRSQQRQVASEPEQERQRLADQEHHDPSHDVGWSHRISLTALPFPGPLSRRGKPGIVSV